MKWQVSATSNGEADGDVTTHEDSDSAVDAFMARVRYVLDETKAASEPEAWRQIGMQWEVDLWFADTTTDMLKRYLTSAEGFDGQNEQTDSLHVSIGVWEFFCKKQEAA